MFSAHKTFCSYFLLTCLLAVVGATAPSTVVGARGRHPQDDSGAPPARALRIIEVFEGGAAERAGLQRMDLLTRYGEFEILDHASYFAARGAYDRSPGDKVSIVVWRGRNKMIRIVDAGKLGVETNEYNPVCYQFDELVDTVNFMAEIPAYKRDPEFKAHFKVPREKLLDEARRVIDQAEQDGRLTSTQVLISRISLIFDDASAEEIKKQSEMIAQLFANQPDSFIAYIGYNLFFQKKRYHPAMECFKRQLKLDPSDISIRLNLGVAYYNLRMWDEAESAADYVFENKLSLSKHGLHVAYSVKAMAALGHGDYSKSIAFAEKSFELNPDGFEIDIVLLAAAETGDLQKLEETSHKFQQFFPEKYEQRKFQVDAVEAYALVKNDQRERARKLVLKWKDLDSVEDRLNHYWGDYAGGSNVAKNWKELNQD